ncbi:MAG: hypothetical protein RL266_1757 [Bacteroidota bacterium]|jgi:hypothetical protein
MRSRIILVLIFSAIAIGYLALVFCSPDQTIVKRSVDIYASPSAVFANVVCFYEWKQWDSWEELNPTIDITVEGRGCGVNSFAQWTSPSFGTYNRLIKKVTPHERVLIEEESESIGTASTNWEFKSVERRTELTCTWKGPTLSFFFRPLNYWYASVYNEYLDGSLQNLKTVSELDPLRKLKDHEFNFEWKEIDFATQGYLIIDGASSHQEYTRTVCLGFEKLAEYARENGYTVKGDPTVFGYAWTGTTMSFKLGLPIMGQPEFDSSEIKFEVLEGGQGFEATIRGTQQDRFWLHNAMIELLADNRVDPKLPMIEIYHDNCGPDSDTISTTLIHMFE